MDENETVTTFGGSGATVVTTDPSATWSSFGNGTFKPTKNGNTSQLGALLASGGQNSQNNSAPVSLSVSLIRLYYNWNDIVYIRLLHTDHWIFCVNLP